MRVKLPSLTSGSERVPRRGEGGDSIPSSSSFFISRKDRKDRKDLFPFIFHAGAKGVANFVTTRVRREVTIRHRHRPPLMLFLVRFAGIICCRLLCCLADLCYLCLEFRRHSGGVRKDFTEKGVIEITNLYFFI